MSYFKEWQAILSDAGKSTGASPTGARIDQYYELEKGAYGIILNRYPDICGGSAAELAQNLGFGQDMVIFLGFLDGVNSSLTQALDLESVDDASPISLQIDFRQLYWHMQEAKADWLYHLEAWDRVLPAEERQAITREYRNSKIIRHEKIGRNDPCPCGSGRKYKNCCGKGA